MSNLPNVGTTPIGVIYAPFQSASLLDVHKEVIDAALKHHDTVVVALPVRRITPAKNSPLDFRTRQEMIRQTYPTVLVVPVVDEKYPVNKVRAIENGVRSIFSEMRGVEIYVDHTTEAMYKEHGKWPVRETFNFLDREEASRKATRAFPNWNELYNNPKGHYETIENLGCQMFRHGIIYALMNQFPISWSTVDICIKRVIGGKTFILLGKKPGEHGWRFPGGFKDRADMCYEIAVHREAGEEVLKEGVDPVKSLTTPKYIGSRNINDWRYMKEIDGITTLFYQVIFIGNDEDIKAGDDLADTKWFELQKIDPSELEGEHVHLFNMLMEFEGNGYSVKP